MDFGVGLVVVVPPAQHLVVFGKELLKLDRFDVAIAEREIEVAFVPALPSLHRRWIV